MRKFVILAALAALASVVLVSTAGARDIPVTLNLIAKTTNGHAVGPNRFVVSGPLLKAGDRSHVKGHFRALFNQNGRARAVAYLRNGKIKVDGNRNQTLSIIGGTRHWAGATGTLVTKNLTKNTTRLTFHVE